MPSNPHKKRKPAKRASRVSEPAVVETTVFRSGNSDAVRLPKRLGLLGKKVRVRRLEDGNVMIEIAPKRKWPPGFFESFRITGDFELPPRPGPDPRDDERVAHLFDEDK